MRRKKQYKDECDQCDAIIKGVDSAKAYRGKWKNLFFDTTKPLIVEIGCGRGGYLIELAKQHPEYNYIGVEYARDRTLQAHKKGVDSGISNVKFVCIDMEKGEDIFTTGEVSRIIINCPEPQEKRRETKHRITHPKFLSWYHSFLSVGGELWLKTDHRKFFEYSLIEIARLFELFFVSCDYRNTENLDLTGYSPRAYIEAKQIYNDPVTEYETEWLKEGRSFFVLRARKK
jgi:tRNA (guanine-N7-)-methyltransferase